MLADTRAFALASRFAAQWLRLEDLEKMHPDRLQYPDFYQQLSDDMRTETEMFFDSILRENRIRETRVRRRRHREYARSILRSPGARAG